MKAAPVASVSERATCAAMPSLFQVASAMSPKASQPILVTNVTLAPTRAAATAWFEPLPPGPILKPEPNSVSPIAGIRPARNARSATNTPRTATPSLLPLMGSLGVRRDHALGEDEAAIEAPLAAGDHAIGLLGMLVEGHALDRHHWPGLAFGAVDLLLHLLLHLRDLLRLAHHLHARRRIVDEAVERHHREDRPRHPGTVGRVDAQQPPEHGLPRHGVGREIRIAEHHAIPMPHGAQRRQHVSVQQRIDILEQGILPR